MPKRVLTIQKEAFEGEVSRNSALTRAPSLASGTYDAILGQIMSLRIPPRARITVDNLARELNVSQTPIREALSRLEAEGLVVKTHLVGYSAAPRLTRRQFDDLYELRLLLEPHAAGRAAERLDKKAFDELEMLTTAMSHRGGATDESTRYSQFAGQDAVFHERIIAAGGNELIRESLARLHIHVHIFRLLFHSRVTDDALQEHAEILKALSERDASAAAAAMKQHIERSRDRLRPSIED